ncbi:hypothetical protein BH11ARM2_BH11ARM2_25100 [soil metagenome]
MNTPPVVVEERPQRHDLVGGSAIDAILSHPQTATWGDVFAVLEAVAAYHLGSEAREPFAMGLIAAQFTFDYRERQALRNRIIYDAAQEAAYTLSHEDEARVMKLLDLVPDPYETAPFAETPEFHAAMDRAEADIAAGRTVPAEAFFR